MTFEVHLRGKPGIVEEIPKGLEQKMFSSHIVSQELEERWALGKRLGRESSLRREAAMYRKKQTEETSPVDKKIHTQQYTWSLRTERHQVSAALSVFESSWLFACCFVSDVQVLLVLVLMRV